MKEFAERLKDLREEKGLSVRELAKVLKISHVAILRWENEERLPRIDLLILVADYFGVTIDYLVGREN